MDVIDIRYYFLNVHNDKYLDFYQGKFFFTEKIEEVRNTCFKDYDDMILFLNKEKDNIISDLSNVSLVVKKIINLK